MMNKKSAGLLLYRFHKEVTEVFLVHPGGPFWKNKDEGSWSVPKGEYEGHEDPLLTAKREFKEETGVSLNEENVFVPLSPQKQKGGKIVYVWATEGNLDASKIESNLFKMEWPPHSGKMHEFPEIDRGDWFSVEEAMGKINPAQRGFLLELVEYLKS